MTNFNSQKFLKRPSKTPFLLLVPQKNLKELFFLHDLNDETAFLLFKSTGIEYISTL